MVEALVMPPAPVVQPAIVAEKVPSSTLLALMPLNTIEVLATVPDVLSVGHEVKPGAVTGLLLFSTSTDRNGVAQTAVELSEMATQKKQNLSPDRTRYRISFSLNT